MTNEKAPSKADATPNLDSDVALIESALRHGSQDFGRDLADRLWRVLAALAAAQAVAHQSETRISAALREQDESTYGDAELPFRMRAHLDPDRVAGPFGASDRLGRRM